MTSQNLKFPARASLDRRSIPNADGMVAACGIEAVAVRAEIQAKDSLFVAAES
jgi:hypothetical protein